MDGTLAHYEGWKGVGHIGEPVPEMVERVKAWLAEGVTVKVFTARCFGDDPEVLGPIREWCRKHVGQELEVTCTKDFAMVELWDDRCVAVETNTGRVLGRNA